MQRHRKDQSDKFENVAYESVLVDDVAIECTKALKSGIREMIDFLLDSSSTVIM